MLERTQQGTLDITPWMQWFLACLGRAFDRTETTLAAVMRKARFWERSSRRQLNERQRDMLNRLLDGFGERDRDSGRSRVDSMAQRESLLCDIAPHEECR